MPVFINHVLHSVYYILRQKGILFWSFSFDCGACNVFLISDSRWNSESRSFTLKPRFINDSFNTCRFLESSEFSIEIFFRQKAWLYGILFISDLGWAEV